MRGEGGGRRGCVCGLLFRTLSCGCDRGQLGLLALGTLLALLALVAWDAAGFVLIWPLGISVGVACSGKKVEEGIAFLVIWAFI